MKTVLLCTCFVFTLFACKRDTSNNKKVPPITGVWIEKTLQLDTLDFDAGNLVDYGGPNFYAEFRSRPYIDNTVTPPQPMLLSFNFDYFYKNDSLFFRPMTMSSDIYLKYKIQFSADGKTLTIDRFYERNTLPNIVVFERR